MNEIYLGDGVYASPDGSSIKLELKEQEYFSEIYLEPEVMQALIKYYEEHKA